MILGFLICSLGVQRGLEKITKVMMTCLLVLIVVLAVRSLTLPGAEEGVRFYLVPNMDSIREVGLGNMIFGAMSQAFFTLSIGAGSMTIFGSYLSKDRSLAGESVHILVLDTFVATMAGLIVIPACFAYGVEPGAGPEFSVLLHSRMYLIRWQEEDSGESMFFLFLFFAALSTVTAVFENIISYGMDLFRMEPKKGDIVNLVGIPLLSLRQF